MRPDALAGVLGGSGAESRFLTTDDGVLLHWPSERSPPWAAAIFLYGIASHRGWFASLDPEDRTYQAYAGAGHTLDFEPDRSRYLTDMLEWLAVRAASASPRATRGDR
jgi:hypothetical protein